MADHPILFQGEMVRATLAGIKGQTRRVVKPQPVDGDSIVDYPHVPEGWVCGRLRDSASAWRPIKCPYGKVGGKLWVRETFGSPSREKPLFGETLWYRADSEYTPMFGWKPSIFMPRWASRITLEITSLAAERVQEISDEDCYAEGLDAAEYDDAEQMSGAGVRIAAGSSERHWFSCLWDSINAKPKPIKTKGKITSYVSYPWEDVQETREHRGLPWVVMGNPMLWVIGFKLLEDKGEKK